MLQEASAFAEEKNMIYYETSAKQNTNVMALFEEIGESHAVVCSSNLTLTDPPQPAS